MTWVIAKRSGTTRTLVRDSLGRTGTNGDDANLIYDSSTNTFRLDAKAGQYIVMFYVKGTYTTFEDAQDSSVFLVAIRLISMQMSGENSRIRMLPSISAVVMICRKPLISPRRH